MPNYVYIQIIISYLQVSTNKDDIIDVETVTSASSNDVISCQSEGYKNFFSYGNNV
jgi:hypothetical protein